MIPPKVFISYSWTPVLNKEKVLKLAERLQSEAVHVILDVWDLLEGHDKYKFMEQMVNNPDVFRVLIICNKDYVLKANTGKGGVGNESMIMSDDIYSSANQTKFIPIIFELDEHNVPFLPTFIKTRKYIDLSSELPYEENYEKLLRNIFSRPEQKRPPLGIMPSYLNTESPIFLPTANKVTTIKNALVNEKKNTPLYIKDYLDTFINSLSTFTVTLDALTQENYIEEILRNIENLKVLRNDYIDFIEVYLTYSLTIDTEVLHSFFERLLSFTANLDESGHQSNTLLYLKDDGFRFFTYELFLTFATILIKNERFSELSFFIQTPYIIASKTYSSLTENNFSEFQEYIAILNEKKKQTYKLNFVSVTSETLKERSTEKYNFDLLKETDVLLHYLSQLFPSNKGRYFDYWFPETAYSFYWNLKILPKTVSKRYFDKVKVLFGVNSKEELLLKAEEIISNGRYKVNNHNYRIPDIKSGLEIDNMCTFQ